MKIIPDEVINFLENQGFVIVCTYDPEGTIHSAAKGIVGIEKEGNLYLIDLYRAKTYNNLSKNPILSITAVDGRQFTGYTLKGKANIVERDKIEDQIIKSWEERVIQRISERVIKNVQQEKVASFHPEAQFPHPQYLIVMEVDEIIDLAPSHLKKSTKVETKDDQ